MIRCKNLVLPAILLAHAGGFLFSAAHADERSSLWAPWPKDSYYKEYPMFHWYPGEKETKPQSVYRFGPVGLGIDLTLPAFGMKVKNVEEGSPAAAGKIKPGQVIESINGKTLKDIDPRVLLGNIITQAEATDGKVTLVVKSAPTGPAESVTVQIPVLGAYSKTWPLKCPKSDRIVRGVADYLAEKGNPLGALGHDQGLLFLLSTGEDKDLEVARKWVKQAVDATKDKEIVQIIPWGIGYGAPGFCEYYLRTGDVSVLPLIKKIADQAARLMYNGGWNHRTVVNFKYGHMNAAGVHCVKFLLLAKECGVDVDEYALQTSLKHFFRYAGRGNVPYGDGTPEGGFVDNGKVGGLAFAMSAAASLTPEGEKSVYAKARDVSAVKSFYSTSWMLHGHTGGGIGEIWRSSAMALMYEKKPTKFREFMDNRMWHLDLSRRFDGSMTVLRDTDYSKGYDNEMWGSGYAMTYTIPRKTLRMTGAPPSKFSKKYKLPERPWGRPADDVFYSMAPAPGGVSLDVDAEKLATHASWPILRRINQEDVSDETLLLHARHPDYNVRQAAARVIREKGRDALIPVLLKDADPRVRQAGLMVLCIETTNLSSISADRLTDEMIGHVTEMIADPEESLWVVQNAMLALSLAKPEKIAPHIDSLLVWLKQDEWWLQRAAITALTPVASDPAHCGKIVPPVADLATRNTVGAVMAAINTMVERLSKGPAEVQKIAGEAFATAYEKFPTRLKAPGGMDMQPAVPHLQGGLASAVASFPGGYDQLFQISRKIMPNEALPYKELYFKSDFKKFGPALAEVMPSVVLGDVIPEYTGSNIEAILSETRWFEQQEKWRRQQFAVGALDGMVELYNEIGIRDYDWHVFGPVRDQIEWEYHSYDAPDVVKNVQVNPLVYLDMHRNSFANADKAEAEAAKLANQVKSAEEALKKAQQQPTGNNPDKTKANIETARKNLEVVTAKAHEAAKKVAQMRQQRDEGMLAGKLPKGMETWFNPSFDAVKAGWKRGYAPFANTAGKAVPVEWRCKGNFCGCGEPPKTLWEKDVLLMRTTVNLPPLKPDHRYRVLLGGNIHSKSGGPVLVYINGKPVHQQGGFGGRLRGQPRGFFIDKELAAEFKGGKVQIGIAAIKPPKAYLSAWIEEMKMPVIGEKEILNALTRVPLMTAEWQEMQDPLNKDPSTDPNEGKYRYNGRFVDNLRQAGEWKVIGQVMDPSEFDGPRPDATFKAPYETLSLLADGKTNHPKWIWTSDKLLVLDRKEALSMTVKAVKGKDYLIVEAGGFSPTHPKGWVMPYLVLEKVVR